MDVQKACYSKTGASPDCASVLAAAVVGRSEQCFYAAATQSKYDLCCHRFCSEQCTDNQACADLCYEKSSNLYAKLQNAESQLAALKKMSDTPKPAATTDAAPKTTVLSKAEAPPVPKNWDSIDQYFPPEKEAAANKVASVGKGDIQMKRVAQSKAPPVPKNWDSVDQYFPPEKKGESASKAATVGKGDIQMKSVSSHGGAAAEVHNTPQKKKLPLPADGFETLDAVSEEDLKGVKLPTPRTIESFMQKGTTLHKSSAPEDELAKEMTHDLEMNFNKIAPFGKEDTAKELQDHAAKTQDTLVDAVENAEVAEIKRAVFRALTRLRAATIKEFDTIARLETQAFDAYNDAHHYRAENPLTHLHEDEAPVETDKLKSFH
jgi:hypothetical protein